MVDAGTLPTGFSVSSPDVNFTFYDVLACEAEVYAVKGNAAAGVFFPWFHSLGHKMAQQVGDDDIGPVLEDLSELLWHRATAPVIHIFAGNSIALRSLNGANGERMGDFALAEGLQEMNARIEALPAMPHMSAWFNGAHGMGHGVAHALVERLELVMDWEDGGGESPSREVFAAWAIGAVEGARTFNMSPSLSKELSSVSGGENIFFNQILASGFYHQLSNVKDNLSASEIAFLCGDDDEVGGAEGVLTIMQRLATNFGVPRGTPRFPFDYVCGTMSRKSTTAFDCLASEAQSDCNGIGEGCSKSRKCAYEGGLHAWSAPSLEVGINATQPNSGIVVREECSLDLHRAFFSSGFLTQFAILFASAGACCSEPPNVEELRTMFEGWCNVAHADFEAARLACVEVARAVSTGTSLTTFV
jgi:hypothetical protein